MSDQFAIKTAINKRASERYDALREFGRHGHYESMYQVIHMAIADELSNQYNGKISIGEDLTAMKLLRGKLSQVAISAEFNEWAARDVCQYIDTLRTQLAERDAQLAVVDERLTAIIDWADLALANTKEFNSHGVLNLTGPVFDEARRYLATRQPTQDKGE